MSVTPGDFLNYATESLGVAKSEIGYRNAISRSYYAVYSLGIVARDSTGLPKFSDLGSHEALQEAFRASHSRELKLIATRLRAAHTHRIVADYRLDTEITKEFSSQLLTLNQRVFSDLESRLS